jgi:hypothetical protein
VLAETYYAAGQLVSKLGYTDLASLSVDRYEWAAERCGDELAVLVGVNGARRHLPASCGPLAFWQVPGR